METTKKPTSVKELLNWEYGWVDVNKNPDLCYEMGKCKNLKEFNEKYGKKDGK